MKTLLEPHLALGKSPSLRLVCTILALAAWLGNSALQAQTYTLNFDDSLSGTIINDQYSGANHAVIPVGEGVLISVTGGAGVATLYNSNRQLNGTGANESGPTGEDPDLDFVISSGPEARTKWLGGNLSAGLGTRTGNLLIIQEFATAAEKTAGNLTTPQGMSPDQGNGVGKQNAPDDNANGGVFTFTFESPVQNFGFDWVDLDSGNAETTVITFYDTLNSLSVSVPLADLAFNSGEPFARTGVVWGDSFANSITPITVTELQGLNGGFAQINEIVFTSSGSGGISLVQYALVPEPSIVALLGLGVLGTLAGRRRRAGSVAS